MFDLRIMLALGCGIIFSGCTQYVKPKVFTYEQLNGRLEAANSMSDPGLRNDAYKILAIDAADSQMAEVVLSALGKMNDPGVKNTTASTCAVKLAEKGDQKYATTVALLITDPGIKNDTLAKIARDGK